MKERDYVVKIMASWIAIDELEVAKTVVDFTYSSITKQTKIFT